METEKITLERKLNELKDELYTLMIKKKISMDLYFQLDNKLLDLKVQLDYIQKICQNYK